MRIPPPVTAKPDGPDLTPFPASEAAGEVKEGRASLRPLLALKPYVLRYRGMIAAALAALIVSAAATLAVPLAVRRMIDVGFSGVEPGLVDKYFATLLGVGLILALASAARFYCVNWLGERVVADIRADIFRHLTGLSPAFYETAHSGEVMSRLTADTTQIKAAASTTISQALRNLVILVGAVAMMIVTSPKLSLLVLIAIPIIVLPLVAYGRAVRDITNNGSTQSVTIRGPSNAPGSGGTLKGFEIAYQTFFDNLPGAWAGLGLQANYTYTDQEGINNSNLAVQAGYLPGSTTAFGGGNNTSTGGQGNAGNPLSFTSNVIDSHRLAGISDDSFNVVGLYEFGKFGARLAYSWRSEFLTANLDCCIGLPVWQKANGYLDGSVRFGVNDNVELSLDVSNILNTTAVTQQQVFGDSTLTPGANPVMLDSGWVRNDRRYQFGVRFKY